MTPVAIIRYTYETSGWHEAESMSGGRVDIPTRMMNPPNMSPPLFLALPDFPAWVYIVLPNNSIPRVKYATNIPDVRPLLISSRTHRVVSLYHPFEGSPPKFRPLTQATWLSSQGTNSAMIKHTSQGNSRDIAKTSIASAQSSNTFGVQ